MLENTEGTNKNGQIQRKWQHRVQKKKKYKAKTQHNMQWPKEKVQKDKQRSTKHYTYKDRVTRTPLNIGSERRCYLKL
jgi:hypothetical protein